ncbi:adenosylcobinamide-GDP ribazoletransferase [Fundidesulfovibrio terrae]|uniref:adenosylcobinamide-GDP ribazoletransferase n=1 Tax=Fundidesulfovibrio terrae TaxID=2922866 RepID=UPI001FAED5FA|nr:adenosylcobinamide-GDP ribazoletransferase [Fundidesulfovibrio terrae]
MHPHSFAHALSFLTRLAPPRILDKTDFPRTLVWFPLVGLAVGALAVLPSWLGLFAAYPWLQGWVVAGLALWLTRGLHADGLADIADAWGSAATGERFWAIMKDSRAGPFGVIGLVMVLAGQVLAFGYLAGQGRLGAACWCFVLGRTLALAALRLCRKRVRPGLSSLFAPGATMGTLGVALAQAVVLGLALADLRTVLCGLGMAALVLVFLVRLSKKQQGFNGDFMGAAIMLGELAGALAALA